MSDGNSKLTKDGDDNSSVECTGLEVKATSNASSSSSSVGWNPQWDDDGSDGIDKEDGFKESNIEEVYPNSVDRGFMDRLGAAAAESHQKTTFGTSNFAASGNQSGGSGSNGRKPKRCRLEESERKQSSLLANLPTSIEVQFSLKKDDIESNADTRDGPEDESERDEISSASSQSSSTFGLRPPDAIRHELLGAPTLVYRHAPSYRDTSQRPSTLTPQQLSLALYFNAHPLNEWFAKPTGKHVGRFKGGNPTDPLLSPTYIPQHPKPWGRPHEWDWRHDQKHAKQETEMFSNAVDEIRRFAEFDTNRFVEDFHCSNKSKIRKHWGQIERATNFQDISYHYDDSSCGDLSYDNNASISSKRRVYEDPGYKFFRAHYIINRADSKLKQGEILDAWRNLTTKEKSRYKTRGKSVYSDNIRCRVFRKKISSHLLLSRYGFCEEKELLELREKFCQSLSKEDADHYKVLEKQQKILDDKSCNLDTSGAQHRSHFVPFEKLHMGKQEINDLLQKERIKWLEWKLHQWDRHDKERAVRRDILKDYYLQREEKKLIKAWEKEESTDETKSENDHDDVALVDNAGENKADLVADNENSQQLLLPTSTPIVSKNVVTKPNQDMLNRNRAQVNNVAVDSSKISHSTQAAGLACRGSMASSLSSSSLASASSHSSSTSSTSTSSFYTYYSVESQFYDWEEHIAEQLKASSSSDNSINSGSEVLDWDCSEGRFCSIENITDKIREWKERQLGLVSDCTSIGGCKKGSTIGSPQSKQKQSKFSNSQGRLDSSAEYMAPFRREDVGFGFRLNGSTQDKPFEKVEVRNSVGGPPAYGNCLVLFPCTCVECSIGHQQCPSISDKKNGNGKETCSWFILHPSGEILSCVTISSVRLPRDDLDSTNSSVHEDKLSELDIGGRILQLSQCDELCMVARTPQFCSVIRAKLNIQAEGKPMSTNGRTCHATYDLQQQYRIDLRSPAMSTQPSYLPIYVACNPTNIAGSFSFAICTILNRNLLSGENTVMHRVTLVRDEPIVKKHDFSSWLADISLVEQDRSDRLGLWAVARQSIMPKLTMGFENHHSCTVTGYGHSLFRINLRDDSVALAWSPSHEEYMTEGIQSIDGIKSDSAKDHILWVSSSSACKVWALDVRYKAAKVVVTWSLPSLCDDFGVNHNVSGFFGPGTLFNQPLPTQIQNDGQKPLPMITVKKAPGSSVLGLHNFPSSFPRFQTKPLESAGFQDLPRSHCSTTSIARSRAFALADASECLFYVGVASLRCASSTALRKRDLLQLGYDVPPANITYVLTMNSMGDIFCHSLLECNAEEGTKAIAYDGLPVGFTSLPLTKRARRGAKRRNNSKELKISLKNEFPCPSDALVPFDADATSEKKCHQSFHAFSGSNTMMKETIDSEGTNLLFASRNPTSLFNLKHSPKNQVESDDGCIQVYQVDCADDDSVDLPESNLNTSIATKGMKWIRPHVEVSHATHAYGLSCSKNESRTTLQSHHSLIAVRESSTDNHLRVDVESGSTPEQDATKEMTTELVNKLKRSYFSNNSEPMVQAIKSEWSVSGSGSEDDDDCSNDNSSKSE